MMLGFSLGLSLGNPILREVMDASGIQFVGWKQYSFQDTNQVVTFDNLADGVDTEAREGDTVIVAVGQANTVGVANLSPVTANGFTSLLPGGATIFSNDSFDTFLNVYGLKLGASPPASVTLRAAASSIYNQVAHVVVIRGGNDTILDVPSTTNNNANTGTPNPPAITPVTEGAWIFAVGAVAHNEASGVNFAQPADLTLFAARTNQTGARIITMGAGFKTDWEAGVFDPAVFNGVPDISLFSTAAATIALRPA